MLRSDILSEDGAHLYRFAFLASQEMLRTARKWRNAVEHDPDKVDFAQAAKELDGAVESLGIWLAPPMVNGKTIDPRDNPDWFKVPDVVRVDIAKQLRTARAGVFSAMGFSEKSAHDVVQRLGEETLEAFRWLEQPHGFPRDYLLGPTSPLRTERQGFGLIPVDAANQLGAECRWEAENAWQAAKAKAASEVPKSAQNARKPILTEPLTKKELADLFVCSRNDVTDTVLAKYPHEIAGTAKKPKYRLHLANMPPAYHAKHPTK